jgi:hypothetical protein
MMAASNEDLLRDVYDNSAVNGGLLGRTFVVRPDEFRPGNSLFDIAEQPESFRCLEETLFKMTKLTGEFQFTSNAQKVYDDWYIPFRKSYEHKADRSGISGRIHTSILKLSMILAVNRALTLIVDETDMIDAIREGTSLLPNYQSFIMTSGKSTIGEAAALLIEDIWNSQHKKISKSEFLSRYIHSFDAELCDKMLTTLQQAELIKMVLIDNTREAYEMTPKGVEKFQLK